MKSSSPNSSVNSSVNLFQDEASRCVEAQSILVEEIEPKGTILSSSLNITNTILGSAMLAMPSALAATGLGFGVILIGLSGMASAFGLYLLTRVAAAVGRNSSFYNCAMLTYPKGAILIDAAIAIKCFGVSISYLIVWGDLLVKIFANVSPESFWLHSRYFWIGLAMLLISPFCFTKQLNSLRYTSAFAMIAVAYLVFVTVFHFFFPTPEMAPFPTLSELEWFKFTPKFFANLPVFVFSFTCHQNIFAVFNELRDNSPKRIQSVIGISVGSSFLAYETIGILGYLTFGNSVVSNLIEQYPSSIIITIGQVAIAILVLFSYPLQLYPCRNSALKVLFKVQNQSKWIFMTLCIMGLTLLVAMTVSDLKVVLGFVGATGSTSICYILPGLFFYQWYRQSLLVQTEDTPLVVPRKSDGVIAKCALGLAIFGVIIMFVSLSALLYDVIPH